MGPGKLPVFKDKSCLQGIQASNGSLGAQNGDSGRQSWRILRRVECRGQIGEKAWRKTGSPEDLVVHGNPFPRALRPVRAEMSQDSPICNGGGGGGGQGHLQGATP